MRFILIFILLHTSALAQHMEWSNTRKLKGTAVFTRVIGENSSGIYLLRQRNTLFSRQLIVERYRHQLGFVAARSISLKRTRLVSAHVGEKGLLLFRVVYNKTSAKNELSATWLNEQFEEVGEPVVLDESPVLDFYDRGDFYVRYAVNDNYLVVYHSERSDDKNKVIHLNVFDTEFNRIGGKVIDLRKPFEEIELTDLAVDNNGNAFLLTTHTRKLPRRVEKKEMEVSFYCLLTDRGLMTDYLLGDTSLYIQSPKISIDRNTDKVNVTGLYSYDHYDRFKGIYNFGLYLDQIGDPVVFHSEISDEMVSTLIGKVHMEFGEEIEDFNILKTVPTSDGGVVVVAERSSISSEEDIMYIHGVPQAMARNIYNYDDVLIVAIDSEGAISWEHVINKSQSSMNDGGYFGSVVVGVTPGFIHIIYNDKLRGNGDIIQYSISGTGEMTNKILLKSERNFVSVIPSEARQIDINALLLPTTRDKKFALLKLVYPN